MFWRSIENQQCQNHRNCQNNFKKTKSLSCKSYIIICEYVNYNHMKNNGIEQKVDFE